MFKMADKNLKKIYSVLLSVTISGLDTPTICFWGSSISIRDSKTRKYLYYVSITYIMAKKYLNILSK